MWNWSPRNCGGKRAGNWHSHSQSPIMVFLLPRVSDGHFLPTNDQSKPCETANAFQPSAQAAFLLGRVCITSTSRSSGRPRDHRSSEHLRVVRSNADSFNRDINFAKSKGRFRQILLVCVSFCPFLKIAVGGGPSVGARHVPGNPMLMAIGQCIVGNRPGRFEPRVVKLRRDQYKKMMKPRNELRKRLERHDNSFE